MQIKPKYGLNLRLPANELDNQWAYMQNVDMTHSGEFEQIMGSVRFHGNTIGNFAPTMIMPSYNNEKNTADVLVAVDDAIKKKNKGTNEFVTLVDGFEPSKIDSYVEIENKMYIPHPDHGLYEYDGISSVVKVNDIKLKHIVYSQETNRCFGISADITNAIFYTDDLSTMGGVPLEWNPLNVIKISPTDGDVIEIIDFLRGRMIIGMSNGFWIYYINSSPENWRPQKAPTVIGLASKKTWKQIGQEFWFLGFSTDTELGIYAFNGDTSRLLTFDTDKFFDNVNKTHLSGACAELVDDIYKISVPYGAAKENDTTLHLDTIQINPNTGSPNIYGPHTYGFSASAVLNNRKFKGEHLFARKHSDGARVFKVDNYKTQYSEQSEDNGDLIPVKLISAIYDREEYKGAVYDEQWLKRYTAFHVEYSPSGTDDLIVEIRKGYEGTTFLEFFQYLEGGNQSIEGINLDYDPIFEYSNGNDKTLINFISDSIQFVLRDYNVNSRPKIRQIFYDAKPSRRKKHAQIF